MTPCCANSHNSMPLRVLTVRTSLHTYISYAHKYTYIKNHITDMLVYRPVLCTLTLVCALANAPTLNLFVYMHMLTSICICIHYFQIKPNVEAFCMEKNMKHSRLRSALAHFMCRELLVPRLRREHGHIMRFHKISIGSLDWLKGKS